MNQYITSEEAIRLFGELDIITTEGAPEIFCDFLHAEKTTGAKMDFGYAARALFNAGRIAGIREERAKRRKKNRIIPESLNWQL